MAKKNFYWNFEWEIQIKCHLVEIILFPSEESLTPVKTKPSPPEGGRTGVRGGSGRRSSGLPSYVGGSRRLSALLPPPKQPPDRGTVMR